MIARTSMIRASIGKRSSQLCRMIGGGGNAIVMGAIVVLGVSRLWLVTPMQITAWGTAAADDQLFVKLAFAVLNGEWLGEYDHMTLTKGPIYPLWLALNHAWGLPLLLAQQALYVAAGLVLVFVLRREIGNRVLLVVACAVYVFNPVVETRVIREAICPALAVFTLAGFAALHAYHAAPLWKLTGWALFGGAALAAFWLTREERLWLLPSLLLLLGYALSRARRDLRSTSDVWVRVVLLITPFVLLGGALQTVASINRHYYGVPVIVELAGKSFSRAYAALASVRHPVWSRHLPVPKAVRSRIYTVSPAFRELRPHLEGPANLWGRLTCQLYPETCGDIAGSWFAWALREAAHRSGHHRSGVAADAYYRRLAAEVNEACEARSLDCVAAPTVTFLPQFRRELIPPTFSAAREALRYLVDWVDHPSPMFAPRYASTPYSLGTVGSQEMFARLTRSPVAPLAQAALGPGRVREVQHQVLDELDMSVAEARDYQVLYRYLRYVPVLPHPESRLDGFKLAALNGIEAAYHRLHKVLAAAGLAAYLLCWGLGLRRRRFSFLWWFNSALLGAILVRVLILALLDVTMFPAVEPWYLAPLYPLLSLFGLLAVADLWQELTPRWVG